MKNKRFPRVELRPSYLLTGLVTGGVMGFSEVIVAISLGSLIFSGELAPYLSQGIGMALATAAITLVVVALTSSVSGVAGSVQDTSAVLLAVIASSLVAKMAAAHAAVLIPTVLVTIALATLLTGFFLLGVGQFRLGGMVRYIPYPVLGGFLAGTGWLLVQGSIGTMADFSLTFANLPELLQLDQLMLWLPGVAFALILLFGLQRIQHFLAMPSLLIGLVVLFYLGLLVTDTSIERATELGLLVGDLGDARWQPFNFTSLVSADWGAALGQIGNIAVLLVLVWLSLLLNATGIELALKKDVDLNRELRAAGLANILTGLTGGMIGYHAVSLTALNQRIGARGRLPSVIAALVCGLALFANISWLAFFPKMLLGGLLLFLGLDFLYEWGVAARARFSQPEYGVVLLILIVIATTNFLIGVGVGLVATVVIFVVSYSRVNVVRHALSGVEIRSNVERAPYYRRALEQYGQQINIFELQGYIFFGTANALLERIRARLDDPLQTPVNFIILDFRRVTGLDSSAILSFSKTRELAAAHQVKLVLTGATETVRQRLALGGLSENGGVVRIFPDLDRGLEWCEDSVLMLEGVTAVILPDSLWDKLITEGFPPQHAATLPPYLEPVQVEIGDYLIHEGSLEQDMYFIEKGQVSAYLELGGGQRIRLRSMGMGTVVGEFGLYAGVTRSASVVAESPTVAYRLTRASLNRMTNEQPELAAAFNELIARQLSERLALATRSLRALHKPD